MSTQGGLYQLYDASKKHDDVFTAAIPGSHSLSLRPFYIPEDFELYNEWFNDEMGLQVNRSPYVCYLSSDYFIGILDSTNAQMLWGMIGDMPSFALELSEAKNFDTKDIIPVQNLKLGDGDVVLRLLIDPRLLREKHPALDYILTSCLTYIAKYSPSGRALWVTDYNEQFYNQLISNAEPLFIQEYDRFEQVFAYNLVSFL